jgi:hypothetical protein
MEVMEIHDTEGALTPTPVARVLKETRATLLTGNEEAPVFRLSLCNLVPKNISLSKNM